MNKDAGHSHQIAIGKDRMQQDIYGNQIGARKGNPSGITSGDHAS